MKNVILNLFLGVLNLFTPAQIADIQHRLVTTAIKKVLDKGADELIDAVSTLVAHAELQYDVDKLVWVRTKLVEYSPIVAAAAMNITGFLLNWVIESTVARMKLARDQ